MDENRFDPFDAQLSKAMKSRKFKEPTDFEIQSWKRTLRSRGALPSRQEWLRLAAASLIGFLIGGLIFSSKNSTSEFQVAGIQANDATIERVYVNLD